MVASRKHIGYWVAQRLLRLGVFRFKGKLLPQGTQRWKTDADGQLTRILNGLIALISLLLVVDFRKACLKLRLMHL